MSRLATKFAFVGALVITALLLHGTRALADNTGSLSGWLTDRSGAPIAGASITVNSPSQSATTTTDAKGSFHFLTLAPDTYTISATKAGYATVSVSNVSVTSDQTETLRLETDPANSSR